MFVLLTRVFSSQPFFFSKLQSADQERPPFPLAGEPLLRRFCFLSVGPPSLKVQREPAEPGRAPSARAIERSLESSEKDVLQRHSSLWLSFSVGKLLVESKLDPLYVVAEFDGGAQF